MRRVFSLLCAAVMALSFAACTTQGSSPSTNTASGHKVASAVIPIHRDENSLNPYSYVTGSPGLTALRLVYDALFSVDKDAQVQPHLAKSYEVNGDYTKYTIEVRDNVRWHDGKKLTPEDVAFTFNYAKGSDRARWKNIANRISSMDVDGNHVTFTLADSNPYFVEEVLTDMPIIAKHVFEDKKANEVTEHVGTGIYSLTEYVPGQKYVLTANDEFFLGKPAIGTLNMPIITDSAAIHQGLKSGEYLTAFSALAPELAETFEKEKSLKVTSGPGFGNDMIYMNTSVEPFKDVEFRQAISLAIDEDALIERVYLGHADHPTAGFYSPHSPWADTSLKYEFDTAKAEKMLDKLGYKREGDFRTNKDGKPFTIELLSSGSALRLAAAQTIAQQLAKIGLDVRVKSMDSDTLDEHVWPGFDVSQEPNYQMTIFGWSGPTQLRASTIVQMGASDPTLGDFNLGKYKNPTFDQRADAYVKSGSKEEKESLVKELEKIYAETIIARPYAYGQLITVHNPTIYDGFVFQKGEGIINVSSFLEK